MPFPRFSGEKIMSITLYTAPDCQRCKIVKEFLAERGQEYTAYDFKDDKDIFNAYYRANRSSIYRNPEGVEFPIFDDGTVIKQGTGEILAYLLSGRILEACVTRSELLHGWISGLNVSACPAGQEDNFVTLVRLLAKGGLTVELHSDGRRADLLKTVLDEGHVSRMVLDVVGPAGLYPPIAGSGVAQDDLKQSIAASRAHADHLIRILVSAYKGDDGAMTHVTPMEAADAAKMVFEACGDRMLPVFIEAQQAEGLEALEGQALLPYRSKVRASLVKAEIRKPEAH
jgi:pyruvate formate lyase activating enzyme